MIAVFSLASCFDGGEGAAPVQSATFVALGTLSGYATSQAVALSADGSIVAGTASTPAGRRQAFRWTEREGPVGLGFMPGGTYSAAAAVAADGSVVLGNGDTTSSPATSSAAFLWTAGAGVARLQPPPGAALCTGAGMSGDGSVVAGTSLAINNEAFLWRGGAAPVSLGRLGDV
jgi:probable HAF family extracellular repeat protein